MTMSKSEAGKLGANISRYISAEKKQKNIEKYNKNPKLCLYCSTEIPYEKRFGKFCNHTCSATFNNYKRGKAKSICLNCEKELDGKDRKYCNIDCQNDFFYKEQISNWNYKSPGKNALKRYLTETFGYKCAVCEISSWNNKKIVLELEHKDGNSENNSKENLCLICPNCHSQTDTYKGKNKGKGRHYRRVRYSEGKSF